MVYRQGATSCQLCCREPAPDQELKPVGELLACDACRQGPFPRDAARAWSLQLRGEEEHHNKHSRAGSPHMHAVVQVVLPTEIPISAKLRRRPLAGGSWEKTIGDAAFDGEVQIESMAPGLTRELLSDAAVRHALCDAVAAVASGTVELNPLGVTLEAQDRSLSMEQRDELDRCAIVLAIAIERWVRGQPRTAPSRPGCVDRPQQAQVDPAVPREAPIPWIPPDSSYRAKVDPGPPCPSCDEPMVNAVTEYVCKGCGHVVDRPKVRQRMRKREIRNKLIVTAVVIALAALIVVAAVLD
jgi:hypothetical protein